MRAFAELSNRFSGANQSSDSTKAGLPSRGKP
jgi:hypothetical protein